MDFVQFFCSIFELVDMWCSTAELNDYLTMVTTVTELVQMCLSLDEVSSDVTMTHWLSLQPQFHSLQQRLRALYRGEEVQLPPQSVQHCFKWFNDHWDSYQEKHACDDVRDKHDFGLAKLGKLPNAMASAVTSYFAREAKKETEIAAKVKIADACFEQNRQRDKKNGQ